MQIPRCAVLTALVQTGTAGRLLGFDLRRQGSRQFVACQPFQIKIASKSSREGVGMHGTLDKNRHDKL